MKHKPKTKQQLADEILLLQQRNALLESLFLQDKPGQQTEAQPLEQVNAQALDCLAGGGEMGALMRALDWSTTPIGPVESWPQSLRTAVSILLNSRYPMFIFWGPELAKLYNDGYRPILGATKHPGALGQRGADVWPEIWGTIGPMVERVIFQGDATWSDDLILFMERNGYLEEAYFTFSYSPIRDETGGVGGMFCACTETTERVLGERRLRTLRDLAARVGEAKAAEQACHIAAETLANNAADVPFALLYLLDANGQQAHLVGMAGLAPDTPASPRLIKLSESAPAPLTWPLAPVVDTGEIELVDDLIERFGLLTVGLWSESPRSALVLPIASPSQERPTGLLVAGISPHRALDDDYQGFLELVAGQIATAVTNARAYQEERKRAEALAELDRAKTTFFSNVSHEFRTPLTLMLGPLEDILTNTTSYLPASEREQLEMVQRNGLRLLKLVNALLDFSRIEAGRIQAVYEPTDLAMLTSALVGVFRSAIERAGMHLLVDCLPLPEPAYVDREMWEKIVLNLLSNAFKFTFDGEIAIALRWADDRIELEVRDTGTGIPAKELPRLFERFHRVQGARGRTYEGSGIGLSLVQELIRLHGGTIQVRSVVDQGTSFTVSIPAGCAHLPPENISAARTLTFTTEGAAPYVKEALRWLPNESAVVPVDPWVREQDGHQARPAKSGSVVTARILLAEDNTDMRNYVKRLLSEHYEVEAVADGLAALSAAQRQVPDLVLSDVMMPGLDGFALLKALRAHPDTREVPVILLSARAGEESRIEGLQAGATDYLVKPFSARELLARVQASLEMARVRQEAEEEIRRLNAQLEQRVIERTAQLAAANKELEAFSYSVSHDLRAPLRSIDGFSQALLEDYTDQLDALGQNYLSRVRAATQRMAQLIDDLLHLSRVTRSEMRYEEVDLSALTQMIAAELQKAQPERQVEFVIAPGLVANGDGRLLRIVLENLLGNAWKFTGKQPCARIEFGLCKQDGRRTYFVRDDGIGFDMAYADKLFGAFQRLHAFDQFEGTGIGLATVQRIILRHSGGVWAAGAPAQGATFYFTI